jgi:hypothetical protein
MAVDGFARALAFAAATAEDVTGLQQDVAEVQASLETTKTELNTTLENTTTELNASLEAAKTEINAELDATTEELNNELDTMSNELEAKRVKIFDSNIVKYQELTEEEKLFFDIAIVAPAVQLTEDQLQSINTMVGEETETVVNLSADELNKQLDNIISGE